MLPSGREEMTAAPQLETGAMMHMGGGCGVDEVGRLYPRNLTAVGYRLHDRADGEAVAVVVDEDESAEHAACKRSPPRLLSFLFISSP